MVKAYWLAVALVTGIALGMALGMFFGGGASDPSGSAPADSSARLSKNPTPPQAAQAPSVHEAPAASSGPPASPPAVALEFETVGEARDANGRPVVVRDSGASAHDDFLREERDDSWAYLREAELESWMFEDINAGRFSKQRIECRATLCEVQLTAIGAKQTQALKKWYDVLSDQMHTPRPEAPMQVRMASFTPQNENGVAEVKFTWQKREEFMRPPPRN
jgi:hypothetical protein